MNVTSAQESRSLGGLGGGVTLGLGFTRSSEPRRRHRIDAKIMGPSVGRALHHYMALRRIGVNELSRRSLVAKKTVIAAVRGRRFPWHRTLRRLAAALGCEIFDLTIDPPGAREVRGQEHIGRGPL